MERILEPELMLEEDQVSAYSNADFSQPHGEYIDQFKKLFPHLKGSLQVVDVGCGPGDIAIRFAQSYREAIVDGFDGSKAMLDEGNKLLLMNNLNDRVKLHLNTLEDFNSIKSYDVLLCNSLLHHLHNPEQLWTFIKKISESSRDLCVLVKDLRRPNSIDVAKSIVQTYSSPNDPQVFKNDFYNSLLASFTKEELIDQIKNANLIKYLKVESVGDRHLLIHGRIRK